MSKIVIQQLKNLASGYEGSAAVLSLSRAFADCVLAVVNPVGEEEIAAGLAVDPAKIVGADLCEMVRRLEGPVLETPAVVAETVAPPSVGDIAAAVAVIEANAPPAPMAEHPHEPIPQLKPQTGRRGGK